MSADLAVILDNPSLAEAAADPGEYIVQCCERGKWWLKAALERDDLESVLEAKAQAEAIRIYTVSKGYGADARLSAEEIIRRSERGLALAVRKGQNDHSIRSKGSLKDDLGVDNDDINTKIKSPGDYVGYGGARSDTYAMTDGVADEDFEEALAEAKAEENLSRANLARKAKQKIGRIPAHTPTLIATLAAEGHSSGQIAAQLGVNEEYVRRLARNNGIEIRADRVVGRTRHHDSNRIMRKTVSALEGLAMGIALIDLEDLDPAEITDWAASLTDSVRALNRFARQLKEMTQ